MSETKPKRKLIDRLRSRFRFVVMNDNTFEERLSVRLTPLGILIALAASIIFLTAIVVSIIAFTPVREYIPGYADVGMHRTIDRLQLKTDSLENSIIARQKLVDNLIMVLSGKDTAEHPANPRDTTKKYLHLDFKPSKDDSALRNSIESMDEYSLSFDPLHKEGISGFFFFIPVKGTVSNTFNAAEDHFGVDLMAQHENEPVRATLDGTVIWAGWTTGDGYVIQVQHSNNMLSLYKHNAALLKKPGDFVKAGDPIAIVGTSGEQMSGPHLHFELWYNGAPLDPQDYMVF
ncbi:MAG TPA: M23 family metallopeptidase [Bacteroidia bacterium]|nr:M23 family metallopeptidase [Bacteroidia bacterium]